MPNAEDIRETLRGYDIRMAQAMRKQMTQRRAALENLDAVLEALPHALEKLGGDMSDCGRA